MSHPIVLENVVFQHPGNERPLRLNVAFQQGQITAVVGPSGSGKSSLLQLINGLVRPNSGTVVVSGRPIDYTRLSALRRTIGYMVQGAGLFPHLSIERNIGLASRIRSEALSSDRIDELMTRMGLPLDYRLRYPHELSGGEQQRAAICMSLYARPAIVLMDESLGSLDAITRVEIQTQLRQLQRHEQCTMVLVTHDMQEALRMGQQLLVMNQGLVEAFGTAAEVRKSESNLVQKLFAYSIYAGTQTDAS
jgi:osmoprotectant transport system ATP-binding protein